jgi:hypothetical protein
LTCLLLTTNSRRTITLETNVGNTKDRSTCKFEKKIQNRNQYIILQQEEEIIKYAPSFLERSDSFNEEKVLLNDDDINTGV